MTLSWQVGTNQSSTESAPLTIWRPPVVLVHGIWGTSASWNTFTTFINDSRFSDSTFTVHRASYDYPTAGAVTFSNPQFDANTLQNVSTNALGFDFNALTVLYQIQQATVDFRQSRTAAATQADVVAHSMGGTITRTLENKPQFTNFSSFGVGSVHKLITIGTPHQGSPLAFQIIQTTSSCMRNLLAKARLVAIFQATVAGTPNVNGGIGDLQAGSQALNNITNPNGHEVPTGLIAGVMTTNANSLNSSLTAFGLRNFKCPSDPLAQSLTAAGWQTFMGGPSDAIVPLGSQLNGNTSGIQVSGVIHTSDLASLGFTPPGELDPSSTNGTQTQVITLLNTSTQSSSFVKLP